MKAQDELSPFGTEEDMKWGDSKDRMAAEDYDV